MRIRSVDSSGDVLPVLYISDLTKDAEAVAQLVKDRLSMFYGEWWENPSWGFQILRKMEESRLTDADVKAFSSMITEYIRETEGVRDVENVVFRVTGKQFSYSCTVLTEYGSASVTYNYEL